ncbi:MAG: hypothetical protein IKF54_01615 [Eubacterium sp.]|nr:hypothetical protein [Eubacterium sp.]
MEILNRLIANMSAYWYVVIPEILYAVFAGLCFFGPGGTLGLALYAAAFIFFPVQTMAVTGAVMAVHLFLVLGKGLIGDSLAKKKKPDEEEPYKGVPKRID